MITAQVISLNDAAERKERLVGEALGALIQAKDIDERDAVVADWVAFYDRLLSKTTQISSITAAIALELTARKGEYLKPRVQGQRTDLPSSVPTSSELRRSSTKPNPGRASEARLLHEEKPAMQAYLRAQNDAGKPITFLGGLQATRSARNARRPVPRAKRIDANRREKSHHGREEVTAIAFFRQLDTLADGVEHPYQTSGHDKGAQGLPMRLRTLSAIAMLLPSYKVVRTELGFTITKVATNDIHSRIRELFMEIHNGRKNDHAKHLKVGWLSPSLAAHEAKQYLDRVEEVLGQIINGV